MTLSCLVTTVGHRMAGTGVDRVEVERDVAVPMRDGTILRADVYRPATGRRPALLQRTPYGKGSRLGTLTSLDPVTAAEAGYAVVVQDVRGRFASEGEFVPFAEALDGHDSVEWVAAQPWCDGGVGMFGGSYMGATQWQAAVTAPPSLRVLCPIHASSDYFEGRSYRGGAFELGALLGIALNGLAQGSIARVDPEGTRRRELWGSTRALLADLAATGSSLPLERLRSTVVHEVAPFFFDWIEHDRPDDYWSALSVEGRYGQADVPALHVSSWFDQFLVGTLRNFEGMRAGGATDAAREGQRLLVGPWHHYPPRTGTMGSARVGDLAFGLDAIVNMDQIQLGWFDRFLKDRGGDLPLRRRVRLWVMGANVWRDEDDWPLARAVDEPLYLRSDGDANSASGGGRLDRRAPTGERPDAFESDPGRPVPTTGGAHLLLETQYPQGPLDQRSVEARNDVLVFTGEPLGEDLEVTGWVRAELWVASTAPSTDVTARLVDVHRDGRAIGITDGIRRVDVPPSAPGEPVRVTVDLGATSYLFREGHRVRLDLAGSNFPRFDLNPHTGERSYRATELRVATTTIFHERGMESALVLPVVGGVPDAD